MTTRTRTYEHGDVTTPMPILAQAWLRAIMESRGTPPSERNVFVDGVVLGMGIDPERAMVNLVTFAVTRPV